MPTRHVCPKCNIVQLEEPPVCLNCQGVPKVVPMTPYTGYAYHLDAEEQAHVCETLRLNLAQVLDVDFERIAVTDPHVVTPVTTSALFYIYNAKVTIDGEPFLVQDHTPARRRQNAMLFAAKEANVGAMNCTYVVSAPERVGPMPVRREIEVGQTLGFPGLEKVDFL